MLPSRLVVVVVSRPLLLQDRKDRVRQFYRLLTYTVARAMGVVVKRANNGYVSNQGIGSGSVVRLCVPRAFRPFVVPL